MSADDADAVRNIVAGLDLPDGLRSFAVELGDDSTGDPAVWIAFFVEDDLKPSKKKIDELNRVSDLVTSLLLREVPQRWPYVVFREPAKIEDKSK